MAFVQVMNNVKSFLAKENLETLNLTGLATAFNKQLEVLEATLKPLRKSQNTSKIKELDYKRDILLMGFVKHCRLFQTFPEEAHHRQRRSWLSLLKNTEKIRKNKD